MNSAILQSLTTGVAVVDRLGSVVALNESWTRLADENGGLDVSLGDNLLLSCEAAARAGDPLARALAPGVAAVVGANQSRFFLDHRSDSGLTPRWWSIVVEPLGTNDGGAVIARTDVTNVRLAELEAQRSRQELAHVARVSTVGELTASLAHQLNQPLGAIMTNAQAARRLLDSPTPDFAKLHAILVDIVKDDRRASDIIVRLRKLLRRGELAMTRVNLTSLIRDVADLVVGDAIVRSVTVSVDLDGEPVFVQGDSVQLQQVVLNLLQNAMDAVGINPTDRAWSPCDAASRMAAPCASACTTPGPDCPPAPRTWCSSRSTRRSRAEWGWGCRLSDRSSKRTVERFGPPITKAVGPSSSSTCRSTAIRLPDARPARRSGPAAARIGSAA